MVDLEADEEEEEEVGEEAHSPLEQDSLMPSDEASDSLSRGQRGSPSTKGGEEEEEEDEYTSPRHTRTYRDMYPPHHGHTGGAHSTNGHESQDRLLQHEAQQGHNQRNSRHRSRPWPRDTYWAEAPTSTSRSADTPRPSQLPDHTVLPQLETDIQFQDYSAPRLFKHTHTHADGIQQGYSPLQWNSSRLPAVRNLQLLCRTFLYRRMSRALALNLLRLSNALYSCMYHYFKNICTLTSKQEVNDL